ncbi:hypothetical protein FGG08_003018 [Glutinoglossum americanum]|uniref:Choline/carnitine acyltransferase domain-containing protein n=1 Tax=Glutinoglossum americanum TaxID=1670608 RepID=A0A9P8IE46_9PEZI|nr:hypothetical protein FGG08_003018 [Glutinoglossum americanum]
MAALAPAALASTAAAGSENNPSDSSAQNTANSFPATLRDPISYYGQTHRPGITFAHEDRLPKLPIPDLESSCRKYLEALQPLQSGREQEESAAAVQAFLRSEGPELQERLKKYAGSKTSYIEQFWYDSYLNFDNPVVLNLNPFFLLEDDPTPARNNQVTRAASLVISALSFVRAIRKEELPPDTVRGQPLCMYQYSRIFGTARVPTENGCQIHQDPTSKHLVVMCRGQFYWFDVLDDNSDLIMSEKDVALNLQAIVEDAQKTPIKEAAKGALGVLSTENRKVWASLRDVLTREEGSNNAECLAIVDSSLFILCLDYASPQTGADLCMNMLCGTSEVVDGVQVGTCTNRWYDKLQIIVCNNGSAGINFEHTGVDGHTVLRMASDVYTDTILRFARTINGQAPTMWASASPDPSKRDLTSFGDVSTTPHKLEWTMIPELNTALRFAETRLADLINQNEFQTLEFSGYGKNFITSMGFSPDAFVQMAYQAAYYGLYGRVECTYEPAMTKVFLHGRTEAVRSVTEESVRFVKKFWADVPPKEKVDALKIACQKHSANIKECAKGLGHDRHLYALFCVWQRALDDEGAEAASSNGMSSNGYSSAVEDEPEPGSHNPGQALGLPDDGLHGLQPGNTPSRPTTHTMPALFADAGWDKINNTILSTSNCGNPSLRQFGFGPTSGDGFGIGYIIKDESVSICASSKHRQTNRFVNTLENYFQEIRYLLRQTQHRATSPNTSRAREAEERPHLSGGHAKSRGRVIPGVIGRNRMPDDSPSETEEDMLGGYGFFDAGMLLQALRSSEDIDNPNEKAVGTVRRNVGRKLRLADY